MNYTRLLGQSNKIYQKFGDYCISETEPNACYIICCLCQEEHQREESFWSHVAVAHDPVSSQLRLMTASCAASPTSAGSHVTHRADTGHDDLVVPPTKKSKTQSLPSSPMYVEAEYLEGVDLSDPDDFNSSARRESEEVQTVPSVESAEAEPPTTLNVAPSAAANSNSSTKFIDIDRISPKKLCGNGELLKRILQQMQGTNNEFRSQLHKLTRAVRTVERYLQSKSAPARKRYMKIIPDQPFTTRDEVLLLDEELHRSKKMRDELQYEEAVSVIAENADVYCRVLWRFIMTDEVGIQFCWRGVVDGDKVIKYPIKDMTMMDVFQAAFREKFPVQASNYFKDRTMTYFNKAQERLKRKQLSKLETAENNACDILNDDLRLTKIGHKRAHTADADTNSIDDVFEEVFC